jgi:hypothetical protein
VEDDRHGRPRFRRWRDRSAGSGAASPVRQTESAAIPVHPRCRQ